MSGSSGFQGQQFGAQPTQPMQGQGNQMMGMQNQMGRPVSAGQPFSGQMPQANPRAFQGGQMGQMMGMQNPYQSGVPNTMQYVQQLQAQQDASAQQAALQAGQYQGGN